MKYFRCILSLIVILAVLVSCRKNRMNPVILDDGVSSEDYFEIPPTGGSFSISFTSDRDWTVSQLPSWLNADKFQGGEGTTIITFEAGCNTTRQDLSCEIVIFADDGSFEKGIEAVQTYPYLEAGTLLDIRMDFEYNESSGNTAEVRELPIKSNIGWTVREIKDDEVYDLSRFDISMFKGECDDTLCIQPVGNNFGIEPYKAAFMIVPVMEDPDTGMEIDVPEEAADRYTVYLSQDNFMFLLNGSPDEFQVEFSELDDSSTSAKVEVLAECPWVITSAPDWVRMDYDSGQNCTISISPDGITPTSEVRSGVVVLHADAEESVEREILVSQKGYLLELSETQGFNFTCDDTTEHIVTLRTTGAWEILNIPDWLEVEPVSCENPTPVSGVTDHEISIRMKDENFTFEPLTADIVFTRIEKPYNVTEDPMDIEKTVVHEAFVFELQPSPVLSRIPTFNTQEYPLTVMCSGGWEVESLSDDWVGISKSSGEKGEETIMVNAKTANPDMEQDRVAYVEFVSLRHKALGVDARRRVEIRQRRYVFEVDAAGLENIPAYKAAFPAYVANLQCSAEWVLTDWPDWLTPNVTSGNGLEDVDISFTPVYNASSSSRSGIIRIRDNYMNEEIHVTATQDAFVFDASEQEFNDVPVMNESDYLVSFDMTAEAPWSLISCPSWIVPSATIGQASVSGSASLYLTPESNPDLRERKGTVVLRSDISGEDKSIEFVQEPYVFDDSTVDLHFTELSNDIEQVEVECSGPWTVDAPSWVNVSPRQGSTSQIVNISVNNNVETQPREVSFVLQSTLNGLTRVINVEQDAYEFDSSAESFEFIAVDNDEEEFEVLSSGRWSAEDVPSWISLSSSSGAGNEDGEEEVVVLSASDNLTESDREADIYVKSVDNASLMKKITVWQEKFILEVSLSVCDFRAKDSSRRKLVSVTCSDDWSVSSDDNWVNITNVTSSGFRISVDDNEGDARTSTVTVKNARSGIYRLIHIVQDGVE